MPFQFQVIKPQRNRRKRPSEITASARNAVHNFLTYVGGEMQKYPPETSGQRYVRTYNMRRGWIEAIGKIRIVNQGAAMVGEMTNTVHYVGRVQGRKDRQLPLFKNRNWESVSDVVDRVQDRFARDIQVSISPFKD